MKTLFFIGVFLSIGLTGVQAQGSCPADILLDLARASSTCYQLATGTVCHGNGVVDGIGFDGDSLLAQPGDQAPARSVLILDLHSTPDELSVAALNLPGDLAANSGRSVSLMALGDVELVNQVAPLPQINATATGQVNIRTRPEHNADVLGRAAVNDVLSANGRTADSQWFRVQVRNTEDYGWASAAVLRPQTDASRLAVVDESSPIQRPFEVFSLKVGATDFCESALPGGLLLQTSSPVPVRFVVNEIPVRIQGTAFLTDADGLSLAVIGGYALMGEAQVYIPAGASGRMEQAVAPFMPEDFAALPLHSLPANTRLPQPIEAADVARLTADYAASQALILATPVPPPTPDPRICSRVARRDTSLYAGPGRFYEVINPLRAGQGITPQLQTTDPDGRVWWQLNNSNWVLAADIREQGECAALPHSQVIAAPAYNRLSLETCETTNGPLRPGQQVEISFMPPPWNNWGEARDAPSIDPGRITIGSRTYYTTATNITRIGTAGPEDRYARRFYILWTAQAGTFRIAGDRLSYEPICTLTVTVG